MPEHFVRQLRHPLSTYRAMVVAAFLGLSLTAAGCTTGVDRADTPATPNSTVSPAPVVEEFPPAIPEPEVSQLPTDEEPQVIAGVNEKVQHAIRNATHVVGIETSYLVVVAARESSFDPRKHAHRTTATGLYQFTADTWLRSVQAFGARHGLDAYARQIVVDKYGAVSIHNAAARAKLLRLRADPQFSALMAAELARDNKVRLEHILGRPVTPAEIYIAHLLGVTQAARVIETAHSAPHTPGARLLPAAARANPGVFKPRGRIASTGTIVSEIQVYYHRQELRFVQRIGKTGVSRAPTPTSVPNSLSSLPTNGAGSTGISGEVASISADDHGRPSIDSRGPRS